MHQQHRASLASLTLGALGVVFGDIGTSPLYTLRECLRGSLVAPDDVLGILSLVFWALTLVVSIKYLVFIMRADNRGEGGIFALLAILPERFREDRKGHAVSPVAILVVAGAALLYGDGAITPAISVLSAVEGMKVVEPHLEHLVVPITCVILVVLFAVQRHGTHVVGRLFGPVMVVWFCVIGALGAIHIGDDWHILLALSPHHAIRYFGQHGPHSFFVLGSVVLAVTGGEALYADMGHFGRRPIRLAWWFLAMPSLVLCYFGQGAMLLRDPTRIANPFFALVPTGYWTWVLVGLSSVATIIASQALISGAFSLTRQAIQLGFLPRLTIRHTAADAEGQIYIPQINAMLAVGCILLVVTFRGSEHLAAAYGIAVTGTMTLTSIVFYLVMRHVWGWRRLAAGSLLALFLAFDLPFFMANTVKVAEGGWVPVLIGFVFVAAMLIWSKGRAIIRAHYEKRLGSYEATVPQIASRCLARVPGTAVFMASSVDHVPPVLLHFVDHSRTLHEHVVLFTVVTERVPVVEAEQRLSARSLGHGFYRVIAHFGFVEEPNVPAALTAAASELGFPVDGPHLTYFLGRESIIAGQAGMMSALPERVYGLLSRNAVPADQHFKIPSKNVVEIGVQMDL